MVDFVVLLLLVVAVQTLHISGIVAAARRPEYGYRAVSRTKAGTVIMVVLTGFVGAIYFFLRVRPELLTAERAVPSESVPPPDTGDIRRWRRTRDPWS
jgi:hypothetical protein